jgi:hypothetical protein
MKKIILLFIIACFVCTTYAQNVGIGTTTPEVKLHITDSTSGVAQAIKLQGNTPFIGFYSLANTYKGYLWENGNGMELGTTNAGAVTIAPAYNPFAYFLSNGTVGIGTPTPQSKLQVSGGGIKADSFTYNTPKLYHQMITSVDFMAREAGDSIRKTLGVGYTYISSNTGFGTGVVASIRLPHGAQVQQLIAYLVDNSPTSNLVVSVLSEYVITGGPFISIAGGSTSNNPGNTSVTMNMGATPFVIDNISHNYLIIISASSGWNYADLGVRAVSISYTLSEL